MQVRLALFLSALLAVFSLGTASAFASSFGDVAIQQDAPQFRLNPYTLEPGCFQLGTSWTRHSVDADSHIDVGQLVKEAHLTVADGANFSIDQVLVPGKHSGYKVHNTFDTGSINNDEDIDPNQTATDLTALGNDDVDYTSKIIVCVSDHPDGAGSSDPLQNEPYIEDGLPGEVAAVNRPKIQPTIAALGVSAVEGLNTYKAGFGYSVGDANWYNNYWREYFRFDGVIGPGLAFGDPQAFDTDGDFEFDHVVVLSRPEQAGVRRFNDIDEFGEQFNDPHSEKSSYGQPVVFNRNGDPFAYLHKSLPGTVDGGGLLDVWQEAVADQTSALGLFTFTAQGDLPITWSLKASLAPESYARRSEPLDYAYLANWNKQWQDYYDCKGDLPELPLAPGTNSPASDDGNDCNAPVSAPAQTTSTTSTTSTTTIVQQVVAGSSNATRSAGSAAKKASKASIRSARVVATKHGKRLVVFVKSTKKTAKVRITMYDAKGRKVGQTTKTVRTNRSVKVSGVRIAGKVKTVKVALA